MTLTAHELLTTTRSVRRRLDLDRPVARETIEECVRIALQAPSGSNSWPLQFVVVTDPAQIAAVAEIYRAGYEIYRQTPFYIGSITKGDAERDASQQRTARSADQLAENLHRVPALVIGCVFGDPDGAPLAAGASIYGSGLPGVWSFMLAARLHGLGTAWTTVALLELERLRSVLDLPEGVAPLVLTPLAHTIGDSFSPALRPDPTEVIHWDRW